MTLTGKDIFIIAIVGVLFSIVVVPLTGFTTAIAFPGWMQTLMTESVTPERSVRIFYFFLWDIAVVYLPASGIPFIIIFSGLLWWLTKATYHIFAVFIVVHLVCIHLLIPLWYGGLGYFHPLMMVQPIILLLCASIVIAFFKKQHSAMNSIQ